MSAGTLYVTVPLWTKGGLEKVRALSHEIMERAAKYEEEHKIELKKMQEEPNPLVRALYYRSAYTAKERYHMSGLWHLKEIPRDNDILKVGNNDLYLCTRGTIWSPKKKLLGEDDCILLGHAEVCFD